VVRNINATVTVPGTGTTIYANRMKVGGHTSKGTIQLRVYGGRIQVLTTDGDKGLSIILLEEDDARILYDGLGNFLG